jgi:DNA-binding transcriptional ArsR family regulator
MMINYDLEAHKFKALAHPVRLQILDMLRHRECCVCHLESALNKRQAYISQQLMVLREAALVDTRREGLRIFYSVTDDATLDILQRTLGPLRPGGLIMPQHCPCPGCPHVEQTGEVQTSTHHLTD